MSLTVRFEASDEVAAPALEVTSGVFNNGHEVTALVEEGIATAVDDF